MVTGKEGLLQMLVVTEFAALHQRCWQCLDVI
uniref:Uncharacterized protein n=1 Tax=Triticum urartu TaxID=4572 RepID=A0A8R7PP64_TRIUA